MSDLEGSDDGGYSDYDDDFEDDELNNTAMASTAATARESTVSNSKKPGVGGKAKSKRSSTYSRDANSPYGAYPKNNRRRSKATVDPRIASANYHQMTALRNQIGDYKRKLDEANKTIRTLKTVEKRQEKAINKLAGEDADFPNTLKRKNEELRILETRLRESKEKHKGTYKEKKAYQKQVSKLQDEVRELKALVNQKHLRNRSVLEKENVKLKDKLAEMKKANARMEKIIELQNKELAKRTGGRQSVGGTAEVIDLKIEVDSLKKKLKKATASGRRSISPTRMHSLDENVDKEQNSPVSTKPVTQEKSETTVKKESKKKTKQPQSSAQNSKPKAAKSSITPEPQPPQPRQAAIPTPRHSPKEKAPPIESVESHVEASTHDEDTHLHITEDGTVSPLTTIENNPKRLEKSSSSSTIILESMDERRKRPGHESIPSSPTKPVVDQDATSPPPPPAKSPEWKEINIGDVLKEVAGDRPGAKQPSPRGTPQEANREEGEEEIEEKEIEEGTKNVADQLQRQEEESRRRLAAQVRERELLEEQRRKEEKAQRKREEERKKDEEEKRKAKEKELAVQEEQRKARAVEDQKKAEQAAAARRKKDELLAKLAAIDASKKKHGSPGEIDFFSDKVKRTPVVSATPSRTNNSTEVKEAGQGSFLPDIAAGNNSSKHSPPKSGVEAALLTSNERNSQSAKKTTGNSSSTTTTLPFLDAKRRQPQKDDTPNLLTNNNDSNANTFILSSNTNKQGTPPPNTATSATNSPHHIPRSTTEGMQPHPPTTPRPVSMTRTSSGKQRSTGLVPLVPGSGVSNTSTANNINNNSTGATNNNNSGSTIKSSPLVSSGTGAVRRRGRGRGGRVMKGPGATSLGGLGAPRRGIQKKPKVNSVPWSADDDDIEAIAI